MHIFGQNFISISLALSQKNESEKWPLITSFQCITASKSCQQMTKVATSRQNVNDSTVI